MTPCEDCGMRTSWPAVDVGVNMHAHQAPGHTTCKRHGAHQAVMAVHGGGPRPVILCRACWVDVYATAQAFLHSAMGALEDHNHAPAAGAVMPADLDLGAILRNVANGRCWCGKPVTVESRTATGEHGRCEAGHAYGIHHFDGGPPS